MEDFVAVGGYIAVEGHFTGNVTKPCSPEDTDKIIRAKVHGELDEPCGQKSRQEEEV